jgi:hypothetical protein
MNTASQTNLCLNLVLYGICLVIAGLIAGLAVSSLESQMLSTAAIVVFSAGYFMIFLAGVLYYIRRVRQCQLRAAQYAVLFFAFACGAAVHLCSAAITGQAYAVDHGFYYLSAMFCSGLICGCLLPRHWVLCAIAIVLGQFPATWFGLRGPFAGMGILCLVGGAIPAFTGTVIGGGVSNLLRCIVHGNK